MESSARRDRGTCKPGSCRPVLSSALLREVVSNRALIFYVESVIALSQHQSWTRLTAAWELRAQAAP